MATTPEKIRLRKQQGFIANSKASGASDEAIKQALPKYKVQDKRREQKAVGFVAAVRGK